MPSLDAEELEAAVWILPAPVGVAKAPANGATYGSPPSGEFFAVDRTER